MTQILTPSNRQAAGFTLIELLVVLAIMSFAAVIAIRSFDARPGSLARKEAAAKLTAAIKNAQREAIRSQSPKEIMPAAIVEGVEIELVLTGASDSIIVYPDGSSNGASISLGGRSLLRVEWLTGAVDVS